MRSIGRSLFGVAIVLFAGLCHAEIDPDSDADYETRQWQELEVLLPPAPRQESLVPFYVSAATKNRFYIDAATLAVGGDGVVRYTLVVQSAEDVRNVSFEGIRCETRERRVYAAGRPDGSWSKTRGKQWVRIQDASTNRHHAALFLDYFCPGGVIARDAEAVRAALRRGEYVDNNRWWP